MPSALADGLCSQGGVYLDFFQYGDFLGAREAGYTLFQEVHLNA
jgi:hypothetical protein